MNKKQLLKLIPILLLLICMKQTLFGISEPFKFVIDTIGIPRYNVYGEEINEDIYHTYNVFVYANPISVQNRTKTQRFKEVPVYGKWTKNGGVYKGVGIRGEYYVLGTSYSGGIIDNIYFPVDARPTTTPDKWNYITFSGAAASWQDTSLYKYPEQLAFMKQTPMLFDADNYRNPPTGKLDLKGYGITATSIGLSKARLNTASTWKTMGVISTKKKDAAGRTWNAIFATAPMSASASVKAGVSVSNKHTIGAMADSITIPITLSAQAINLNYYANKKHIKQIVSILYIGDKEVARVSGSKTVKVDKNIIITVSRKDYPVAKDYPLSIKVKSYLYTEFSVDGLMQDEIKKEITLNVVAKEVIPVTSIEIKSLQKQGNVLVVSPLVQTIVTNKAGSKGLIEAGKYLAVKINKNLASNISPLFYCDNKQLSYQVLVNNNSSLIVSIPLNVVLDNTLASWNYLREKNQNYFSVAFNKIGDRVRLPHMLKLVVNNRHTYEIPFDSIDNFQFNTNYLFQNGVTNSTLLTNRIKVNDWK